MLEGFAGETRSRRGWLGAGGAAAAIYVGLGCAVFLFATAAPAIVEEKLLEVSFEAPKPPPPPPMAPRPKQPVLVASLAPPPVFVPKEIPPAPPPEAEAPASTGDAYGTEGSGGGLGTAAAAPPPPPEPINLPEEATPPVAASDNAAPGYPESARSTGQEGQVILKIVVSASGAVTRVEVLRGDSPFVEAATAAVRSWRYEPARLGGKAIAVFRIVKIPFRLSL